VRVLEVEMHTQLNCQSKQTQNSSSSGKEQSLAAEAAPLEATAAGVPLQTKHQNVSRPAGRKRRRRGPRIEALRGARGSRASPPLAPRSCGAGQRGNLPCAGISTRACSFAPALPAWRPALPSRCLSVAPGQREGPWHGRRCPADPGEPRAEAAAAEVPWGCGAPLPSLSTRAAHPRQEITSSTSNRLSPPKKSLHRHRIVYRLPRNHFIDKLVPL